MRPFLQTFVSTILAASLFATAQKRGDADDATRNQNVIDALKRRGAIVHMDDQGNVTEVDFEFAVEFRIAIAGHDQTLGETLRALKRLPKLKRLSLRSTAVTETDLAHLKDLAALKELDLSWTNWTSDGLRHISALTHLQQLDLSFTKCTDAGLSHLAGHTNLTELDLDNTKCTDAGLVHLKGMTQLENLSLGDTAVTDAGLVHLKSLNGLKVLDIGGTVVTDAGVVTLKALNSLREIGLSDTFVSDKSLKHLVDLSNLESVGLSNSRVTLSAARSFRQHCPNVLYDWGICISGVDGKAMLETKGVTLVFDGIPLNSGGLGGSSFHVWGQDRGGGGGGANGVTFEHRRENGVNTITIEDHTLEICDEGATLVVGDQTFDLCGPKKTIAINADGVAREVQRTNEAANSD